MTTTLPQEHYDLAIAYGLSFAAILREGVARELLSHGVDLSAVPTPRQGRPPRG